MSDTKNALDDSLPSEITGAVSEVPALATITVLLHSVLGALPAVEAFFAGLPESSAASMQWVVSLLLALVLHVTGYFWDGHFYDPRYRSSGYWINKERPWGIFPSGKDLESIRTRAREQLLTPDEQKDKNISVYDRAEVIASANGRFADAAGPEILSKFARSLILPAFCATAVLVGVAIYRVISPVGSPAEPTFRLALLTFGMGLLAFVPYVHFRVKHVKKLYHIALLLKGKTLAAKAK